MGSITRMNRNGRFRKQLEDRIVAKAPFQQGDWIEVVGIGVGESEDGSEVSKLYITVRNKRTGDEDILTFDECLYCPEDVDENNVNRLHDYLYPGSQDEEFMKRRKEVIKLLKKAELINPKFKAEPL